MHMVSRADSQQATPNHGDWRAKMVLRVEASEVCGLPEEERSSLLTHTLGPTW